MLAELGPLNDGRKLESTGLRLLRSDIRVNEFKSAHVQLPGLLIMSSAERSAFGLEGSQLEALIRTSAKLSAPRLICSVSDGGRL